MNHVSRSSNRVIALLAALWAATGIEQALAKIADPSKLVAAAKSFLLSIGRDVHMAMTSGNFQMATAGVGRNTLGQGYVDLDSKVAASALALHKANYAVDPTGAISLKTSRLGVVDGNDQGSASACHGLRVHKASQGTVMANASTADSTTKSP